MNSLQILIVSILLSAYMENTHNGKENEGKLSTYQLIKVQHEQNFRSFFSFSTRRVGLSQKPVHTTVPLKVPKCEILISWILMIFLS
jgi:hypothetical protein